MFVTLVRDKGVSEQLRDSPRIWEVLGVCLGSPRYHGCSMQISYQLAGFLQSVCLMHLAV